MNKTLLIIMTMAGLFLSASEAEAKGRFSVIPRVGFNLSSIGGEGSLDAYSTRLGFTGGVDAEYRFIPQLGVSLGVAYSQHMLHINKRGVEGIKIRIDTPHNGVPYNHMHIQYERTGLYYDKNLNPVDRKSPNAHIRIR